MGVAYYRIALIKKEHIASVNIRILPDDTQSVVDSTINLIRGEVNEIGREVENQLAKIFTFFCRFLSLKPFFNLFLKSDIVRLIGSGSGICIALFFTTGEIFQLNKSLSYCFYFFQELLFCLGALPVFCSCA